TVTATAGANGSISPTGTVTVNHGGSQTYTFTPNEGYAVDSIKVNGAFVGSGTSYTLTQIDKNTTIAVSFRVPVYAITASAGSNGSISPSGTVTAGLNTDKKFSIT